MNRPLDAVLVLCTENLDRRTPFMVIGGASLLNLDPVGVNYAIHLELAYWDLDLVCILYLGIFQPYRSRDSRL